MLSVIRKEMEQHNLFVRFYHLLCCSLLLAADGNFTEATKTDFYNLELYSEKNGGCKKYINVCAF